MLDVAPSCAALGALPHPVVERGSGTNICGVACRMTRQHAMVCFAASLARQPPLRPPPL
jgi:hypothetical protein